MDFSLNLMLLQWSAGTMLFGDLKGKEIQKRVHICIRVADSLCCTIETNVSL